MTITAVPDPLAWTVFSGSGSNQTLLGRATIANGRYVFTPEPVAYTSGADLREIADKLDALNAP
jgi:hypothetical protein